MLVASSLSVPPQSRAKAPIRSEVTAGSASSEAMDRLVPGDYPQVEQDLAAFPQPTLDLLSRYGIQVAVLEAGKTLADSPGLRTLSEAENDSEARQANALVSQAVDEAFARGITSYAELEQAADDITRQLRLSHLDHLLGIALNPFSLEELAQARNVPVDRFEDWKASFHLLNQGLTRSVEGGLQADKGLVILPHTYHQDRAIPEIRLRNAQQVTAEYVEGSLGLNRADERMVLLHEKFIAAPAPELGNYRLATHEIGHALDYALENLTTLPDFGPTHRATVDSLFAADQAKLAALGPSAQAEQVFTSDRADDNVREYFAEAIEAYLTPANDDEFEIFRVGNSQQGLADKNPALFNYVEQVLTTNFPESAVPNPPARNLVPPGIPDPDLEVVAIS